MSLGPATVMGLQDWQQPETPAYPLDEILAAIHEHFANQQAPPAAPKSTYGQRFRAGLAGIQAPSGAGSGGEAFAANFLAGAARSVGQGAAEKDKAAMAKQMTDYETKRAEGNAVLQAQLSGKVKDYETRVSAASEAAKNLATWRKEARDYRTVTDADVKANPRLAPFLGQMKHASEIDKAVIERPGDQSQSTLAQGEAEDIANEIIAGRQPPIVQYRYAGPVRAALARKHYDLGKATQDWNATQRYFSSLNGPQQVRLRQATNFAYNSLDLVDGLSKELSAKLPRTRFPVLNRKALQAAKAGLLGSEAQNIATKLDSQIADLQSELAVVYRGGYASTDEALKKASMMLSGDWAAGQLQGATNLARQNLQIRLNSINSGGAVTPSNPTAPSPGSSSLVRMQDPYGRIRFVPADKVDEAIQQGGKELP